MILLTSVLADLLQALPQLRPYTYFKSSLTALSHAMEDQVLAGTDRSLIIASFQQERFYRQEAHRYQRIAERTNHLYVLAASETEFKHSSEFYETVAFAPTDQLSQEWHLVVIGQQYANCLICRERPIQWESGRGEERERNFTVIPSMPTSLMDMDTARQFEGIWTFDHQVSCQAAELLLNRILAYRPELAAKIEKAKTQFLGTSLTDISQPEEFSTQNSGREKGQRPYKTQTSPNPDPFAQRLVTYLQAGQYKLLKAYRSIAAQERKERLVNSITAASQNHESCSISAPND